MVLNLGSRTHPGRSHPNAPAIVRQPSIAFVGTYPPRACGIATYTQDLRHAVAGSWRGDLPVFALDRANGTDPRVYPEEVTLRLHPDSQPRRVLDEVTAHEVGLLCVQHEFGIYPGPDGRDVLDLIDIADVPTVSTLHTLPTDPSAGQAWVLQQLARRSHRVVVMSERGRRQAIARYAMDPAKLRVIPHGVPDLPLVPSSLGKSRLGLDAAPIILSFGLIGPNKGLEAVIMALANVIERVPAARLVVAGATHPEIVRREGERYRRSLEDLAARSGLTEHVQLVDRYLDADEVRNWLLASDVFVTAYSDSAQVTSGTLAYAIAAGRAVVSTPYEHARESLSDGRGVLVPFGDVDALAAALADTLGDEERRTAIGSRAWAYGRRMVWPAVGAAYARLFDEVLDEVRSR